VPISLPLHPFLSSLLPTSLHIAGDTQNQWGWICFPPVSGKVLFLCSLALVSKETSTMEILLGPGLGSMCLASPGLPPLPADWQALWHCHRTQHSGQPLAGKEWQVVPGMLRAEEFPGVMAFLLLKQS
jgi:hypothetical protein